jgi:hypothetical protein
MWRRCGTSKKFLKISMMPMVDSVVFPFLKVEHAFIEIWECSRNLFLKQCLLGELFSCNAVGQLNYDGNYSH